MVRPTCQSLRYRNFKTVIFSPAESTWISCNAPSSCSPNGGVIGLAWLFEHVDRDEPTQTVHICLAFAVTFCPTIDGMSHPRRRATARCLCAHMVYLLRLALTHIFLDASRKLCETSVSPQKLTTVLTKNARKKCLPEFLFPRKLGVLLSLHQSRNTRARVHMWIYYNDMK